MSDSVERARSAKQSLAQGLAALQQPGAPPELGQAAQPIAEAMSALHGIEASGGASAVQQAPHALEAARRALAFLQTHGHPAAQQAANIVAGSLGRIHELARISLAPPGVPAHAPAPAAPVAAPQAAFAATMQQAPAAYAQQQPPAQHPVAPANAAPAHGSPPAMPGGALIASPQAAAPGTPRVEAELGAHSATNFYKGLAGNDVVDSGGIFVATYQIPEVGESLLLRVSMPGGYEFEALAAVRWTREAPLSRSDSPPGFGAQFTSISPEARQLVYRYVRNREPLFYDDF